MEDAIRNYIKKVKAWHEQVKSEEATKSSLIAPLFTLLGYDLADPQECVPEAKADFGKTRGKEPCDWAFYQNGRAIFLVEAKHAGTKLDGHGAQLGDYFAHYPGVKLGVLTNGVMWRFFTDIIHTHLMDEDPFVTWDVLNDDRPPYDFLKLLQKSQFKTELVQTFAKRKHEHNLLINELAKLLEPTAEFTRLAIANIETRPLTPDVLEYWKPVVASAVGEWAKQRTLATVLTGPPGNETWGHSHQSQGGKKDVQGGGTLADLIAAGILTAPLKLFRKYKGQTVEADLLPNGHVKFQGVTHGSCSQAAGAARGFVAGGGPMATNGWTFWQYRDAAGKRHSLDDARKHGGKAKQGQHDSLVTQDQPERHSLRKKFWQGLLGRPNVNARHANIKPGKFSWIAAGSGVKGCPFTYAIGQDEGRVEFFIDRGPGKKDENKRMFDWLHKHKSEIEQAFGGGLDWLRLDDKQACRIAHTLTVGGWRSDESKWPGIHDAMIDAMTRLENALTPLLPKLNAEFAS